MLFVNDVTWSARPYPTVWCPVLGTLLTRANALSQTLQNNKVELSLGFTAIQMFDHLYGICKEQVRRFLRVAQHVHAVQQSITFRKSPWRKSHAIPSSNPTIRSQTTTLMDPQSRLSALCHPAFLSAGPPCMLTAGMSQNQLTFRSASPSTLEQQDNEK